MKAFAWAMAVTAFVAIVIAVRRFVGQEDPIPDNVLSFQLSVDGHTFVVDNSDLVGA